MFRFNGSCAFCSILRCEPWDFGLRKLCFDLFWFAVSEAAVFVENQLCGIAPIGFFWVLSVRFLRRCMFQVVSVASALKLRLI
ncbi:hypothetical protein D5E86_26235 [Vibrio parahaemolyticus]|nr:hypothetical protein D5E86_26235 [Vibrio parahaemolyticus]